MARMSTSSDSGGSTGSPRGRSSRVYICKKCGSQFQTGQSLGGHMNVHKKEQSATSSRTSTPPHEELYASNSPGVVDSTGSTTDWSTYTWTSSYKGVRYRKEQHKWVAEIRPPRSPRTWWLGTYSTPEEAAYAYDVAIKFFRSETSLNFDGNPVYDRIPTISEGLPNQDFAVQLRKVVKEYGMLAMQADKRSTGASISSREEESVEDSVVVQQSSEIWQLDDFPDPSFPDFDIDELMQPDVGVPDYGLNDYEYNQPQFWSPNH